MINLRFLAWYDLNDLNAPRSKLIIVFMIVPNVQEKPDMYANTNSSNRYYSQERLEWVTIFRLTKYFRIAIKIIPTQN